MKKKKLLFGIAATIVAVVIIAALSMNSSVDVRTFKVEKGDIQEYIKISGKVELDKKEKVYSKFGGIVENIKVGEGDSVDEGSELLTFDIKDLDLQIEMAKAAYNSSKANLEALKKTVKPEEVRQAQTILDQARIGFEASKKNYEFKKDQLDKVRSLYENGAVSQQSLKEAELVLSAAKSALDADEQKVSSAELNLGILKKGVSKEAIKATEYNVQQAKLQVDELLNNKGKAIVYSGMKGIVLARHIEKGIAVQPGTLLYEIGDYSSAYILVNILVDDAGKVKIGQKVAISGDILGDKEIQGEIYFVAPKAESVVSSLGVEQQRIEMKVKFDNSSVDLKPGYSVDVDIITNEKKSILYVPGKVVFTFEGSDSVFAVVNGKLEVRKVDTGIENEDNIEINGGLKEGEVVVVDPDSTLKPGAKVK